jgi:hypothetical protein
VKLPVVIVVGVAAMALLVGVLVSNTGSSDSVEHRLGPTPTPTPLPDGGLDFPHNDTFERSSVSQHDITWEFDGDYTVGQFANGDWWVVGPVTLTAITPDSTDEHNGENINPARGDEGYDANLGQMQRLDLPQTLAPGSSIVKGVSRTSPPDDNHRGLLQTAAVLTVVDAPPPRNGAIVFRPPYFEQEKPQYLTTDLRTDLLPQHEPPEGDVAPLSDVESAFARLQLDHNPGNEDNRLLHPVDNMADYGAWLAQDSHFAALRLMLEDPVEEKSQALINYVQYGIDLSAMVEHDSYICADVEQNCAGHGQGRTLPLVFAATLLDSQEIKDVIAAKADGLPENFALTQTDNAPTPLFGDQVCTEEEYLQVLDGGPGAKTCRDPYAYVDGGDPLDGYQDCCMSQPWKAAVTAMHLMPELQESWPESDELIEYMDRWVDFGFWTQPDPHARFPSLHGTEADGGLYRVELADALWDQHNLSDRVTTDWSR